MDTLRLLNQRFPMQLILPLHGQLPTKFVLMVSIREELRQRNLNIKR